jgi:hypothetical protein
MKKDIFIKIQNIILAAAAFLPSLVSAQRRASKEVADIIVVFVEIIYISIPILTGLGLALFLWGVVRYIGTSDEGTKQEARSVILYGIITLFAMVAVWGLVYFVAGTLGIGIDNSGTIPPQPYNISNFY